MRRKFTIIFSLIMLILLFVVAIQLLLQKPDEHPKTMYLRIEHTDGTTDCSPYETLKDMKVQDSDNIKIIYK